MTDSTVLLPELAWTGERFETGWAIEIHAGGCLGEVGPRGDRPMDGARALPRTAVLPGFVSAHSHAFQRGLRGRGETFRTGAGSFWSWREAMYELVDTLDPERVRALSGQAFAEMRAAGITTVGEFHYVHHGSDDRDFTLDQAVLAAARDAGIRIVLLQAHYRTGSIGQPLRGGQRRFDTVSLDRYWEQLDELTTHLHAATQSLGVVAHSIRAVPREELPALHAGARQRDMMLHLHIEEQRAEIQTCMEAYGCRPMEVLLAEGVADERVVAVHCTHTDPVDMDGFLGRGGRVCLCPLTEANLGDGVPDLPGILRHGETICVGTDLNSRLCMLEELRMLEYEQRLVHEQRGVARGPDDRVAPLLLRAATSGGAAALGLHAGTLESGAKADLAAIDLDAPALHGANAETLPEALVFGGGPEVVRGTWVDGVPTDALA